VIYIDFIICIPLIWGIYRGFLKGIILELASIVALFLGILVASKFSVDIKWMFLFSGKYNLILAFAFLFLLSLIFVFLVAKIITKLLKKASLGTVNKLLGAAFGGLKFALILSVVFFMIDTLSKSYPILNSKTKYKSLLYKPIAILAPIIIPELTKTKNFEPKAEVVLEQIK
jgi:membrane protein required for colicin V production